MPDHMWVSLGGAPALAIGSLLGKVLLRYRICDAGLITWSQGLATAVVATYAFRLAGTILLATAVFLAVVR